MTVDFDPAIKAIDREIHISDQVGMIGTAALLRAYRNGRITLFLCQPENAHDFKNWAKITAGRPAVVSVGDDDGLLRGAAAWRGYAHRMARWASHVVVHAAGG